MNEQKMTCPHCGESILEGALKCKYCREWVENPEKEIDKVQNSSVLSADNINSYNNSGIGLAEILKFLGILSFMAGIFSGAILVVMHPDMFWIALWLMVGGVSSMITFFVIRHFVVNVSEINRSLKK